MDGYSVRSGQATQSTRDSNAADDEIARYLPFLVMAAAFLTFLCMAIMLCRRWCKRSFTAHNPHPRPRPPPTVSGSVAESPSTVPPVSPPDGGSYPAPVEYMMKPPPYCELPPSYNELFAEELRSQESVERAEASSQESGNLESVTVIEVTESIRL